MDSIRFDIQPYVGVNEIRNMHMLASKLIKNKDRQIVLSIGDEGWNITKNGFEIAVKQICDYNLIPYENIIIESGDILEKSQFFKHRYIGYNGDAVRIDLEKLNQKFNLPESFNYGLFYARPDDCRLYSFYKHISSNNRLKGIATMHFDPRIYSRNYVLSQISEFVINYPDSWAFIKKELPYSDFGYNLKYPIIDHNNHWDFWHKTYSTVAVEIVSETIVNEESFFITEKTFRPILHGRLFMIIGSPGFEKSLKSMGFDIFDDIIDKSSYDQLLKFYRIDRIYDLLNILLNKHSLKLMKKLKSRLEKNSKLMKEFILDEKEKYQQLSQ